MWAGLWTIITIPWVQADLRREKQAWARIPRGEPYTDDITAPTPITRFVSASGRLASMVPFYNPDTSRGGGEREEQPQPAPPTQEV